MSFIVNYNQEVLMYENAHGYHFITWEEMEAYEKEHGLLPPGVPVIVAGVKVR